MLVALIEQGSTLGSHLEDVHEAVAVAAFQALPHADQRFGLGFKELSLAKVHVHLLGLDPLAVHPRVLVPLVGAGHFEPFGLDQLDELFFGPVLRWQAAERRS